MFRLLLFFSVLGASYASFGQQLIINEISQGTGSSEYVEFVVIGSPTCTTPVPSLDLRKVIIDDNNGYFATGSGTGIASGAVRFANIPFWQSVPQGTYIVIYNETSPNAALPPNDLSLTDGNCRLIIPASSTLLEKTTVSPTTTNTAYPPDPDWTSGGAWNQLAMANSDDSFQVPTIPSTGIPFHSVSWGNNSNNTIIYFSGSASGKVFSFTNNTSNNWNTQANWTAGNVGVNETPGAPNNVANDAWIATMNPQCSINPGLSLMLNPTNETCANACDGAITTSVTNGQAPFSYEWSNGAASANLTNLCPGTYSLEVTTATGCSVVQSVTILGGQSNANATIQNAGPFTDTDPTHQIIATNSGGTWTSTCGSCLSSTGVFNPQVAGIGTWQICYSLGAGACSDQQCINVVVTDGCSPQIITENVSVCPGDSVLLFGNYASVPSSYSQVFVDVDGCDSTHVFNLSNFQVTDVYETVQLCEFDSVFVFNQWIFGSEVLVQNEVSSNGCSYTHTISVVLENCSIEPEVIFVPNVFTPNNDLTNDTFEIVVQGGIVEEGYVLNRWGSIIAKFNETQLTWDGTDLKSGLPVQDGVYTYLIYFKPAYETRKMYHGFVTVIR